jgi:peptidoglycan/LPS O-acetylase OafA/YrhL
MIFWRGREVKTMRGAPAVALLRKLDDAGEEGQQERTQPQHHPSADQPLDRRHSNLRGRLGHPVRTQLNPTTVRRLDAVRALAALYVVACHVFSSLPGGSDAVIAFFLLSGFVIHANEHSRARQSPCRYLLRRARRLYPLLIVAMALSVALAALDGSLGSRFTLAALASTLVFQSTLDHPFMDNVPLWSLSYEALYYVAYPVLLLVTIRWRFGLVVGVSMASLLAFTAHPSFIFSAGACLAIWWAGAEAARFYGLSRRRFVPIYAGLGVLLIGALGLAILRPWLDPSLLYPRLPRAFAAALLLLWAGIAAPPAVGAIFGRLLGRAAMLAPISYGLYVIHYPLVAVWSPSATMPFRLLVAVPLAFLLAWVAESALRRGGWIRSAFAILSRRLAASRHQSASVPYPAGVALAQASGPVLVLALEAEQA